APAPQPTARCWCSTTCSGSTTAMPPGSPSAMPRSRRRWWRASPNTRPRCARRRSRLPSTRIRSTRRSSSSCAPVSTPPPHKGPRAPHAGAEHLTRLASGGMPRLAHVFAPRDRVYFELFEEAGQNVLQASDLLDRLLSNYPDNKELAREILDCEHEG